MAKSLPVVEIAIPLPRHGRERHRYYSPHGVRSRTKQEFREECDINNIMKRYEKDGLVDHVNKYQGQYGDFTDAPEYQDALNKVASAEAMFMTLPANIRARYENDPGKFLQFVDNASKDQLRDAGLLRSESVAVPEPAPVTSEKK